MLNISVFWGHKWTILFYGLIILLIIVNKKRFDMHGILALYRTKIGLRFMERLAARFRELIKILGYIGIGVGFLGLFYISAIMLKALYDMLFVPNAPAPIAPVIPGVPIPGSPIDIPLISGWLALFIVVLVHEFSHGVVLRAHSQKVKSSGVFFLGPLMGAFVEPEEKKLQAQSDVVQYSVASAGPVSNVALGVVALIIMGFVLSPVIVGFMDFEGVMIKEVMQNKSAEISGMKSGEIIREVDGIKTITLSNFTAVLKNKKPGDELFVKTDKNSYKVILGENPQNENEAYLGVYVSQNQEIRKSAIERYGSFLPKAVLWLFEFFKLLFILSLGIGLINLWPIFITDGARMMQVAFLRIFKDKDLALRIWKNFNMVCLLIIFALLLPIVKKILEGIFYFFF